MKLLNKIQSAIAVPAGFLVVVGIWSVWGFARINHQIGTIYDDRMVPLSQLKTISDEYGVEVIDQINKVHAGLITPNEALKSIKTAQETIDKEWHAYTKTYLTEEEKALADKVETLFNGANEELDKVIKALESGSAAQAGKFDGPLYKVIDPLTAKIQELSDLQLEVAKQERSKAGGIFILMTSVLILLSLATILVVLLPIRLFINKLIVATLRDTVNTVATSSTEIAAAAEEQERLAERQSASVNKTTTTMDELRVSAQQSAQQAETAAIGAKQILVLSENGKEAVIETVEGMGHLKEKVDSIIQSITLLNQQLSQIDIYQQVVAELADQTNLLSLNASVEAVRAGDQGKGFAVVAAEIRKLAASSKNSADKINTLVADIQKALQNTVKASQEGSQTVDEELRIAQKMSQTLISVTNAIDEVVVSVQQISLNTKQQAIGVDQIVEEMNLLNQTTAQTVSGITQTKVGTQRLQEKAGELKAMV